MDAKASIIELKLKIQEKLQIPLAKQKLIHNGAPVEDGTQLASTLANNTVYLIEVK